MNANDPVSDEQLNALLDNELDDAERARLFEAIRTDNAVSARYCTLRQVKEMVTLAYNNPPLPASGFPGFSQFRLARKFYAAAAAVALMFLGGVIGWSLNGERVVDDAAFYTVDRLNPDTLQSNRILLHLSTLDDVRISDSLGKIEELLKVSAAQGRDIQVEVVANSDGLNILRRGSRYAEQIRSMTARYDNVSFMACGIAKHNAELKEGKQIALIPEAKDIPAAMERILQRVTGGWSYVRG
jgi:intracellular sulfur oxidation DsrE/DsrF family protein